MARGLVPRGDLGFCHYERSEVIQKQVLLAMGLLLSLRSIASDKFRVVMARSLLRRRGHLLATCHRERSTNCHRERSVAICCDEIASTTPQV